MKVVGIILALASSAAAFAPPVSTTHEKYSASAVRCSDTLSSLRASLSDMAGYTAPFKGFDPLGLADLGSEETLAWFRAAELKHSRVAMLATSGYIFQAMGFHFPGMLSKDISFESLSTMKPFDAWDAVPEAGKQQIIGLIFLAEIISESQAPHYLKGGDLPTVIFPPFDFSKVDAETLKTRQNRELNNGRLAMIAIMSFVAAANVPGSVPALANNPMF